MNFGKVALLALASASMVFMASCKDDKVKKAAPTVEVKTAGGEVLKGAAKETDFALVVEAKPAKDLKVTEINYMVTYGTSSSKLAKLSLEKSKTLEAWLGKIERTAIPAEVKEGKIKITAIDSDKNQTIKEIDFNFSGTTPTPNPGETGWNAEKQGAINHATGGKNGAFNPQIQAINATPQKRCLAYKNPQKRREENASLLSGVVKCLYLRLPSKKVEDGTFNTRTKVHNSSVARGETFATSNCQQNRQG